MFTNEDDGTRYFQSGISDVETDFAWSDGCEGRMSLTVGEQLKDLIATVTFKSVYNDSQTMIVTSNGQEYLGIRLLWIEQGYHSLSQGNVW